MNIIRNAEAQFEENKIYYLKRGGFEIIYDKKPSKINIIGILSNVISQKTKVCKFSYNY